MNREIKFRIWRPFDKVMMNLDIDCVDLGGLPLMNGTFKGGIDWVWMQFIGLHDENGKEIYEGDVVKLNSRMTDENGHYVVKSIQEFFTDLGLCVYEHGENWDSQNIEIVGNIFENPELI